MEVKEAYCSFEIAKLLKEKGFDTSCLSTYDINNGKQYFSTSYIMCATRINAPTHQMALTWVRSKGYSVEIHATAVGWHWEVCKINGTSIAFGGNVPSDNTNDGGAWDDYDECTEAALKYALENLI